jgi:hypothetical protein
MTRQIPGAPTQAKNNPVIVNKTIESGDTTPGQSEPRVLRSEGDAAKALDPNDSVIQVTDRVGDPEKAMMLAFMNELIDVRLATSTDKNAEQVVEIGVNGRVELLRRGEVKTVPRFIVDRLARCKVTTYQQTEVVNAEGIKQIVNTPITGLRYDFSVTCDPSPYAEAWLKSVLAERG